MQDIVIDKPYRFVPPHRGGVWPAVLVRLLGPYLRWRWGIEGVEVNGAERLAESLRAGHAVLLAPNHCRDCDPVVMGALSRQVGRPFYLMASWHLFMQGRLLAWVVRRAGAFSIYREGMDRSAIAAATEILESAQRPLVVFPEGVVSRTNDRLNALMEGVALIAHSAARKRAKQTPPGQVVVHPVGIRYRFHGDIRAALEPVLDEIERRLSWRPQHQLPLLERIYKLGHGLLCLKEIEYFGGAQEGEIDARLRRLIDQILVPLEQKWLDGQQTGTTVARVKRLRTAILPDLVKGELDEAERQRRWQDLADVYLAQQLWHYPPDYIRGNPTSERLLETVERFEEDLTDRCRVHRPMSAEIRVGEAIIVSGGREQSGGDGLMAQIEQQLQELLGIEGESAGAAAPAEARQAIDAE